MEKKNYTLHLPLGKLLQSSTFNLEKAVCSHGFFMMAPNNWDSSTKVLRRPFRLSSNSRTIILVHIYQPSSNASVLHVQVDTKHPMSAHDQKILLAQVTRMLRISEKDERDITKFHDIHSEAESIGFGRIFRSPTLFEDIVKCILLCNCGWDRTLAMVKSLCDLQMSFTKTRSKRRDRVKCEGEPLMSGDFPTWEELASVDAEFLKKHCNLGYRANTIIRLATMIKSGKLSLENFEKDEDFDGARKKLQHIKGIGVFISDYVVTCIGDYQKIPADTETIRHITEIHARKNCNLKTVQKLAEEIYGKFAPFQYLAYWFELWKYYEEEFGNLSALSPDAYRIVTGSTSNRGKGKGGIQMK
ncbi:hypothetical protein FRX31_010065 [Thalictrum thalictroides]|uniref:HhH-GPD domain-containing protein n=1 Tax=Thalictrum thalictroides TaxID=46969 RepID=A0A7J6WUE3_THATH|nr:hypothetical protein FRX31_010065 [Thalictrum thalictroides]